MLIKEFTFNTLDQAQAFIEGVENVNDSTMRIRDVVLEIGILFAHRSVFIGGKPIPVPDTRYVVLVEDDDEDPEDEKSHEGNGWVRLNYGCTTQVSLPGRK